MKRYDLSPTVADQRALQGIWLMIRFEHDGVISKSPLNTLPRDLLVITGNRFEIALPGRSPSDEGTFVIDADTIPKTITWITSVGQRAGRPLRGIYDLHDDHLVLVTAEPFQPQPTEFRGRMGNTMRTFIRA